MHSLRTAAKGLMFMLLVLVAPLARADSVLDFTIENQTGFTFKELYLSPTGKDSWGKNLLAKPLKDKESKKMKAKPTVTATVWDMRVVYDDGKAVFWRELEPSKFARITLKWNKETGKTSITRHRS